MTDMTDEQFNAEVAALEKELAESSAVISKKISDLQADLNNDFAEADKTLEEYRLEIEKGTDEQKQDRRLYTSIALSILRPSSFKLTPETVSVEKSLDELEEREHVVWIPHK